MHICFFIGGLSGGGAERVTCNLANYMVGQGHNVEILTMADDEPSYPLSKTVRRNVLLKDSERRFFVYNSLLRLLRLYRYLHKTDPDVIVVMLPVTTILLLWMRGFTKAKIIAAERATPTVYSDKEQKQLRTVAHKANGWVFQTKEQQEWYNGSHIRMSRIIPNAINPMFIGPTYVGKRKKSIITIGRLISQKNHELLINAFATISDLYPDYSLVIYGEGYKLEELQKLAHSLGVAERVSFPGYTKKVVETIIDASLFVLSSDYEGMPNALMEAMALGLPCISTDCDGGGARFLIEDGVNGLLVPKNDVDALASAMDKILSNPEMADRLGMEAHKICERLAPERVYSEWESFITEIVNSK